MRSAKRIFLFLAVNFLVVITISVVLNLLNIRPFIEAHGINYYSLMIFCLIWGMGGAFISLALSRQMAKWLLGVKVIDPTTESPDSKHLLETVYKLAKNAKLSAMPEVGIYESSEVNAFATGPSQKRSLVAVSTGLLNRMNQDELEGVLAHEITHISNGDMVTMTLLQGVVNAFVMFLARILAFASSGIGKQRENSSNSSYMSYYLFVMLFEVIFMVLGSLIISWFSRQREFRADRGGAFLAGKNKMVSALEALQNFHKRKDLSAEKPALQMLKISSSKKGGLLTLFATHPPLEVRIERLKNS